MKNFVRSKVQCKFILCNHESWNFLHVYQHGLKVVKNLKVVNDIPKNRREDYGRIQNIIHDKDLNQNLLKIVKDYLSHFPSWHTL